MASTPDGNDPPESSDRAPGEPGAAWPPADLPAGLLKDSFAHMMTDPRASMEYFFADLFARSPDLRALFPSSMTAVKVRFFAAVARLAWTTSPPGNCIAFLDELSRSHRKFGVREQHYAPFFAALLATVRHCCGPQWTDETRTAWERALTYAELTMLAAARRDEESQPPWWLGEVTSHDRRSGGIAVLTTRPDQPLAYSPGQNVDVQVPRWPRQWRSYSVASAPRPGGDFDLHVRAIPGGRVSNTLVHHARVGDTIALGAARGDMTLSPAGDSDLLCIAGGTGLAPVKVITEAVIKAAGSRAAGSRAAGSPDRAITVLFGARRRAELYDLDSLQQLAASYPALTVIPVVSAEPGFGGQKGLLPDVAAARDDLAACDISSAVRPPWWRGPSGC